MNHKRLHNSTRKLSTKKTLHIVSFDVPVPANYGGVIDVFNRAKALKDAGFHIVLHCFEYGRSTHQDFESISNEVHFYKREKGIGSLLSSMPYIVKSRANKTLLSRLEQDNSPILLEGQHCSAWATILAKNNRKIAIRQHNVESEYYEGLAKRTSQIWKKWFYLREARLLKKHLITLQNIPFLALTEKDVSSFESLKHTTFLLPVTLPLTQPTNPLADDNFYLFHGNLSVPENEEAVLRICLEHSKNPADLPIIIAGKDPSETLKKRILTSGITLVENPDVIEMARLQQSSSVHLLIGFQKSGVKLKVLQALQTTALCITTNTMISGTEMGNYCAIWDEKEPLFAFIAKLEQPSQEELDKRQLYVMENHGVETTVRIISEILF